MLADLSLEGGLQFMWEISVSSVISLSPTPRSTYYYHPRLCSTSWHKVSVKQMPYKEKSNSAWTNCHPILSEWNTFYGESFEGHAVYTFRVETL